MNEQFFTSLNGYKVKDEYAIHTYDSVALMKADSKLKEGMHVKTKGYYNANDGGQGEYIIVDDNTLTPDNGYIHSLINGLFAKLIIDKELNAKQFGCYGDGIHDDTEKLNAVLNISNVTINIPKGTYNVSDTLYLNGTSNLYMDKNCLIKATAEMTYLLYFNYGNDVTTNKEISGGVLDGNDLVDTIFIPNKYRGLNINNTTYKNFIKSGIQTKVVGGGGVELVAHDLYFWNIQPHEDSIAIDNVATDGIFSNIVIKNTHYGVLTKDGLFSKIHGWIESPELIPNSYFIKSNDKATIINQCYADTYQYPFISTFSSLNIVSCLVYWNSNIYNQALQEDNPIIVFKSERDIYNLNSYGSFKATNNTIANQNDVAIKLRNMYVADDIFSNNTISIVANCDYSNYAIDSTERASIGSDVNNLNNPGKWWVNNATNIPTGAYEYGIIEVIATPRTDRALMSPGVNNSLSGSNVAHIFQRYTPMSASPDGIYIRTKTGGTWQPWKKISLTNIGG